MSVRLCHFHCERVASPMRGSDASRAHAGALTLSRPDAPVHSSPPYGALPGHRHSPLCANACRREDRCCSGFGSTTCPLVWTGTLLLSVIGGVVWGLWSRISDFQAAHAATARSA